MATRTITVGTAGVPLDREVGGTDLSTDRTAAEMRTALPLGPSPGGRSVIGVPPPWPLTRWPVTVLAAGYSRAHG